MRPDPRLCLSVGSKHLDDGDPVEVFLSPANQHSHSQVCNSIDVGMTSV